MSKDILLLGEFSTGKSAFINMLLGVSILPERVTSTDLPVVKISNGKPAGIWLREPNQKNSLALDTWNDIPKDWSKFEYAEITIPDHPLLAKELVIWDTPGINSTNEHHKKHLDNFLTNNENKFNIIYFFLHSNLTMTSLAFLNSYEWLYEKLIILVNIKDVKPEAECRIIEKEVRREIRSKLGLVAVELLYIGDVCEEFNELSEKRKDGLSDYALIREWNKINIDLNELLKNKFVIGEEQFSIIEEFKPRENKSPHVTKIDDYSQPQITILNNNVFQNINSLPEDMVFVNGGEFMMGNDQDMDDQKPAHKVKLNSFYIDKYLVTQEEYKRIMGKNPSFFKDPNNPAENVNWYEADEYARKIGKRLPTEAEWEYAAKGGKNLIGSHYSGSSNIEDVSWYNGNSLNRSHPVGLKKSNSLGIFDMSGNVWEWCQDWYLWDFYFKGYIKNPRGPEYGSTKVLRGGSWFVFPNLCSVTFRERDNPQRLSNHIGFRCVTDA